MLRILDLETDLALDVDLPNKIEDAFRIQLGRCHDVALRSRFGDELAAWISVAVFQSVDRDLWPPTDKQRRFADAIAATLQLIVPDEAYRYRGSMAQFLDHYGPIYKAQKNSTN